MTLLLALFPLQLSVSLPLNSTRTHIRAPTEPLPPPLPPPPTLSPTPIHHLPHPHPPSPSPSPQLTKKHLARTSHLRPAASLPFAEGLGAPERAAVAQLQRMLRNLRTGTAPLHIIPHTNHTTPVHTILYHTAPHHLSTHHDIARHTTLVYTVLYDTTPHRSTHSQSDCKSPLCTENPMSACPHTHKCTRLARIHPHTTYPTLMSPPPTFLPSPPLPLLSFPPDCPPHPPPQPFAATSSPSTTPGAAT
jgi:hypothetical protein